MSLRQAATGKDKSSGRAFKRNQATKSNGSYNNPFLVLWIPLSWGSREVHADAGLLAPHQNASNS